MTVDGELIVKIVSSLGVGAAALEFVRRKWLTPEKAVDAARELRDELRKDLASFREEVASLRKENSELHSELLGLRADYTNLLILIRSAALEVRSMMSMMDGRLERMKEVSGMMDNLARRLEGAATLESLD